MLSGIFYEIFGKCPIGLEKSLIEGKKSSIEIQKSSIESQKSSIEC